MYVFADKFFNIALPRVRDFKGVSKNSFDGRGNYTMGIKEQLIFLKSIMIRSIRSRAWISRSPLRQRQTKKRRLSSNCWVCRLRSRRETWLRHLSKLSSRRNRSILLAHIQDARLAEDHILYSESTASAVSASEKWRTG